MKDLKNLKGAKVLSKLEQQAIKGGLACEPDGTCPPGTYCCYFIPYGLCRVDGSPCPPW